MEKEAAMSQWKIWGSERNTKTGENSSTKYNRLRQFRLQPSMFQVIIGKFASVFTELSGISLNQREAAGERAQVNLRLSWNVPGGRWVCDLGEHGGDLGEADAGE